MPRRNGAPRSAREELQEARSEFDAAMRGLKRRQRAAIERAEKAIDARKASKIRKTIDDLSK